MTQEDFSHWLELGLGRAVLFLQQHDATPYRDQILNACLHNLAYDHQVEDSRAQFMFDVISATGELDFYKTEILKALATTEDKDSQWQLFDMAGLLALSGDRDARRVICDTFAAHAAQDNFTGADTLLEVNGLEGLLSVVHHLSRHPLSEDDQWLEETYLDALEEKLGKDEAAATAEQAALGSPELAAFLARVKQRRVEWDVKRRHRKRPAVADYATISGMIATGSNAAYPIKLARWGEEVDENTLLRLADDLLREADPERLKRYLRLFHRVPFPRDPERLLGLALDGDEATATAARKALAQIASPEARQIALGLIADSPRPWEGIDILQSNFQPGDYGRIETLSAKQFTADERHALGHSVFHVFKVHPQPEAIPTLLWLYETDPCSFCRNTVLDHLLTIGPLPDWMIAECRYDADSNTRKLAAGKTAAGQE